MDLEKEKELFKRAYLNLRTADSTPFPDAVFDEYARLRDSEGYKLVPLDPKFETMQEMNTALIENSGETPKYRMQQVYKAMIGSCNN